MDLKKLLKKIKLNEKRISMFLGVLVVLITGVLTINYLREREAQLLPALNTEDTNYAKTHTVEKGESLWTIAEKYYGSGYNWTDIAADNNLTNYSLEIGQQLNIPNAEIKLATGENLEPTSNNGQSYTVAQGDSLWSIAVATYGDGYKWVEIAKANNLTNPNVIHSGNVLILP